MGPRFENRGFARHNASSAFIVVSPASMGPRFENRGFERIDWNKHAAAQLQWVHGSRTVVLT